MIFIDVSQYSKGQNRADDQAFKNLNALIVTDRAIQQNDEFFLGAPGREQAISLENQRVLGVSDAVGQNLSSIIAADANSILGAAATRSVAGLMASAEAQFTLPAIPSLAQSKVDTKVANQFNSQYQSEVITPNQQQLKSNEQQFDMTQQPTLFEQEASNNLHQSATQGTRQLIDTNNLNLKVDLQAGERALAIAQQQYDIADLKGKQADQPAAQNLVRAQRNVAMLRARYNQGVVQDNITNQPLTNQIRRTQLEGVERRLGRQEQTLDYNQERATLRAYTDLQLEGQAGLIRKQIQDYQQAENANKILTQPQQQHLQNLQRQYKQLQTEINIRTAPKIETSNNITRNYNDNVTRAKAQRLPAENDLKASQTFLAQLLTDVKVGDVPSIDKLNDAERALKQMQVASSTKDQPQQAKYDTARLALNNLITKIKSGNVVHDDDYRDAVRAYNVLVTASNTAQQPAKAKLAESKVSLQQMLTNVASNNVVPDAALADAQRELQALQVAAKTADQPLQATYNTAILSLNNVITKIKSGNAVPDDEYRDAVRALNVLNTASATKNQPAQAQLTSDQTKLQQGRTNQAITNLTDDATIADLTRRVRINELEFTQLTAPQKQRMISNELKIKESNISLALRMLPVTQLAKTLQQGMSLDDVQQLKKNKQYAYEVQDIKAQQAPDAARANQYAQSLNNGGKIIQQLNVKRPISLTKDELATAAKNLQNNGLLNPGQSLMADSTGIFIQSAGAAPIPLDNLYRGILATLAKPTKPKATTYKTTTYIQDGVAYPVNTVTSTGAPPTAADRQFAGGDNNTPDPNAKPPPTPQGIIGAPAAKAALDAAAQAARGY